MGQEVHLTFFSICHCFLLVKWGGRGKGGGIKIMVRIVIFLLLYR